MSYTSKIVTPGVTILLYQRSINIAIEDLSDDILLHFVLLKRSRFRISLNLNNT